VYGVWIWSVSLDMVCMAWLWCGVGAWVWCAWSVVMVWSVDMVCGPGYGVYAWLWCGAWVWPPTPPYTPYPRSMHNMHAQYPRPVHTIPTLHAPCTPYSGPTYHTHTYTISTLHTITTLYTHDTHVPCTYPRSRRTIPIPLQYPCSMHHTQTPHTIRTLHTLATLHTHDTHVLCTTSTLHSQYPRSHAPYAPPGPIYNTHAPHHNHAPYTSFPRSIHNMTGPQKKCRNRDWAANRNLCPGIKMWRYPCVRR